MPLTVLGYAPTTADEPGARQAASAARQEESNSETPKADDDDEGEGGEGGKTLEERMRENEIKARWGLAFVTVIIIFSVAFVKATNYIKEAVPKELEEVRLSL
jgi:hypothetical protein